MEQTSLFRLDGKIALITGASRGIGEAAARLFAQQGAQVIISSRKIESCQMIAESINAEGGSAEAFPCHIGDMNQIDAIIDHIKSKYGKLDILVNNAAANPYFGPILDTDLGAYQKTIDVNIRGYFFMSVAAGKLMRENGGGSIINIASINGMEPGYWQGVYSISKAAIINMKNKGGK
jgi:NAD(P)-dependent dehydrogenase (short-subunit alcohol dehydrogenase family)